MSPHVRRLLSPRARARAIWWRNTLYPRYRALKRMAELVDEGQARGEIATRQDGTIFRDHVLSQDKVPATLPDLGITRQRLHEARAVVPATAFPGGRPCVCPPVSGPQTA